MPHKTRVLIASIAVAATTALVGCSADADDASSAEEAGASPSAESSSSAPAIDDATDDDVTVLVPGGPGEEASTGAPDTLPEPPEPNDADVEFLAMMVPHHAQAVEMADLAALHASAPAVQALAERIRGSQAPEIVLMSSMLEELGEEPSEHGDHGSHEGHAAGDEEVPTADTPGVPDMPGMLTRAQLDELAQARGRTFDRLFLQRMIAHHEGALTMAGEVAVEGADIRVGELAADMSLGQAAEISRMRELLGS